MDGISQSISIGDIVSIATFILGGLGAYTKISERLKELEVKVGDLWERRHEPR